MEISHLGVVFTPVSSFLFFVVVYQVGIAECEWPVADGIQQGKYEVDDPRR